MASSMLVGHGIEVSIRGGPDNHEFPRADSSSPFRSARHEHASTLTACDGDAFTIRVTVLEDFQWYQSNALSLEVEYGRTGKLFQLSRIPRPRRPRPITVDLERCYLWVPGPECWRTYATQFVSTKHQSSRPLNVHGISTGQKVDLWLADLRAPLTHNGVSTSEIHSMLSGWTHVHVALRREWDDVTRDIRLPRPHLLDPSAPDPRKTNLAGPLVNIQLVRPLSPGDQQPLLNGSMVIHEPGERSRKYRRMHFGFACHIKAGTGTKPMAEEHEQLFPPVPNPALQASVTDWLQDMESSAIHSDSKTVPPQDSHPNRSTSAHDRTSKTASGPSKSHVEASKASSPTRSSTIMANTLPPRKQTSIIDLTQEPSTRKRSHSHAADVEELAMLDREIKIEEMKFKRDRLRQKLRQKQPGEEGEVVEEVAPPVKMEVSGGEPVKTERKN